MHSQKWWKGEETMNHLLHHSVAWKQSFVFIIGLNKMIKTITRNVF